MSSKEFALMGLAGYIAPRHLKAIKDTGNKLVAAMDTHDNVGVIDAYFPHAAFFTEFERFDRHLEMLRRSKEKRPIDYLSICTPNYLHDAHIRFGLRLGANVICEKPLVLSPKNIDLLQEVEDDSEGRVFPVLQLRVHPTILELRERFRNTKEKHDIDLTYVTPRGTWYFYSWKGQMEKSGGVVPNIGIHFFDMLIWIFGDVVDSKVHLKGGYDIKGLLHETERRAAGYLELEHARVRWFLSVDREDLPPNHDQSRSWAHRSITVDGEEIEFSDGFTDLHTTMYEKILDGEGFGLQDARPAIAATYDIRKAPITEPEQGQMHPMTRNHLNGR